MSLQSLVCYIRKWVSEIILLQLDSAALLKAWKMETRLNTLYHPVFPIRSKNRLHHHSTKTRSKGSVGNPSTWWSEDNAEPLTKGPRQEKESWRPGMATQGASLREQREVSESSRLQRHLRPNSYEKGGFSGGSDSKESACSAEDLGLSPGLGWSPGEGNGYPVGCKESNTTEKHSLSFFSMKKKQKDLRKSQQETTHYNQGRFRKQQYKASCFTNRKGRNWEAGGLN